MRPMAAGRLRQSQEYALPVNILSKARGCGLEGLKFESKQAAKS